MSPPRNPIVCDIPLDQDGKHHGHLRLPYSHDGSAWGAVMIPICVIRNGSGPTALLTGANHGDEYEGPIALQSLAHDLDPGAITGRVILLPYLNTPAFQAATRTSPLDGCNLNRIFPGRADGSPSEKIADFVLRRLVPLADLVLDFHSGGKTLEFVPFAAAHRLDDPEQQDRCIAAMLAFNAPYSMILREIDAAGMFDTAVEALGKTFVTTELGGGGSASATTTAIARRGLRNILIHMGILQGAAEVAATVPLDTQDPACLHVAPCAGLLECLFDLGAEVRQGSPLARIWPSDRTGADPVVVMAATSGVLATRHFPGLIAMGDCLAVVAHVDSGAHYD